MRYGIAKHREDGQIKSTSVVECGTEAEAKKTAAELNQKRGHGAYDAVEIVSFAPLEWRRVEA